MLTKVFITNEIDDLILAVEELVNHVSTEIKLQKNSCGFLFCNPDMEQAELARMLYEKLPFDIIGCTAAALMDTNHGFLDMVIALMVFTSNDCEFSLAVSEDINSENVIEEVRKTYEHASCRLTGQPKLIFAMPPYNINTMLDDYVYGFDEVAKGVPVIGGIPSHNDLGMGERNLTIYNDSTYENRLVIMAMSGNIRPIFSVANVLGTPVERKRRVNKSKDNVVYRVGSQTFTEYLEDIGIDLDKDLYAKDDKRFFSNPVLLEHVKMRDGDEISFVRTLTSIRKEDGSAVSIGRIPQGASLSVCTLRKEEIQESARKGMQELIHKINKNETDDYHYTTVLAISCMGRYLIMSPKHSMEVNKILEQLPQHLTLGGFYSQGELGPLSGNNSELINFAHNESLVLCAF